LLPPSAFAGVPTSVTWLPRRFDVSPTGSSRSPRVLPAGSRDPATWFREATVVAFPDDTGALIDQS